MASLEIQFKHDTHFIEQVTKLIFNKKSFTIVFLIQKVLQKDYVQSAVHLVCKIR